MHRARQKVDDLAVKKNNNAAAHSGRTSKLCAEAAVRSGLDAVKPSTLVSRPALTILFSALYLKGHVNVAVGLRNRLSLVDTVSMTECV